MPVTGAPDPLYLEVFFCEFTNQQAGKDVGDGLAHFGCRVHHAGVICGVQAKRGVEPDQGTPGSDAQVLFL
ncbi:MAG: hypothetical protein PVJ84_17045 [Desulfobacteraceae bacterium]